jgi:Domain of unknown function (DUF4263)
MKSLDAISFDLNRCRTELDRFKELLDSETVLVEREHLLPLFKDSPHLTPFIGTRIPEIGPADRLAYEFQVFGDFAADIVLGNFGRQTFCAIELEDAGAESVFHRAGAKATTEWGRRFEHGFSQLVDWFFAWDDHKSTTGFAKHFGYGHIEFYGMLLIGRSAGMSDIDRTRLRWRSDRVTVNSHKVYCRTYDELYDSLDEDWRMLSFASKSPKT